MAKLDENGHEILDDTPVALPTKFRRAETLTEQVRRLIREEASRVAEMNGYETFEEADDFEVDDDYDPRSPHELSIEQELEGYEYLSGKGKDAEAGTEGRGGRPGTGEEGIVGRGKEVPGVDEKPTETAGSTGGSDN